MIKLRSALAAEALMAFALIAPAMMPADGPGPAR
ncbi:hypothetical protein SAMN05216275_11748 [Streptosporangium canum]|uniref:Uncharacterized protein n=1 Tax=Streptosporangium canum TaxID=324952 RepID=A0A1I3WNA1_9ACTN|nr:hypothetical protein SAMN05216275_11748 [Streptosporangium canum]